MGGGGSSTPCAFPPPWPPLFQLFFSCTQPGCNDFSVAWNHFHICYFFGDYIGESKHQGSSHLDETPDRPGKLSRRTVWISHLASWGDVRQQSFFFHQQICTWVCTWVGTYRGRFLTTSLAPSYEVFVPGFAVSY
jgi:hypothetical protein